MLLRDHDDLGLIGVCTGETRRVAGLAVRAMLAGQSLDCQIVRTATGYTVTITEVSGESIVSEVVLNVVWADITEAMRFGLLALYCEQLVLGGERGVRQADVALRAGRARCTAQG